MLLVILYFVLNFAGFLAFLAIWNWLPKPKPFDYTTIPGMKLNVSSAEEIPEMVKLPGEPVDKEFNGNFDEITKKTSDLRELLDFLNTKYGPLSSFWWSSRYVVVVSDEKLIGELKKFRASLVAVSPFSIGSYLHAHHRYCTTQRLSTLNLRHGSQDIAIDKLLFEPIQNKLVFKLEDDSEDDVAHQQTNMNLKQCRVQLKKTRKSLGRPLLVVFDEEIWVDAHPIPKFVSNHSIFLSN
uniref:O-fucosyltransferase family protein n=1 Tax=Caenorhabditis tropicalis TaxID=1561998 RepID=A0A1I7UK37_9PELO